MLHQTLLVLPQCFKLPPLRRDQVVQRAEAVGNLLLLSKLWKYYWQSPKVFRVDFPCTNPRVIDWD